MPQIIYVASVLDPRETTYEKIDKLLCRFVNTGSTLTPVNRNWITQEILYGSKAEGGLSFIDAREFFLSLKVSWIKTYASDRLDDHWADIIDKQIKIRLQELKSSHGALKLLYA